MKTGLAVRDLIISLSYRTWYAVSMTTFNTTSVRFRCLDKRKNNWKTFSHTNQLRSERISNLRLRGMQFNLCFRMKINFIITCRVEDELKRNLAA